MAHLEKRYPNLRHYLELMKDVAKIILVGTWILLALFAVWAKLSLNLGPLDAAAVVFSSLLWAGLAYFYYVVTMVGLEFVWVVIDIEENTRSLDLSSRQQP